MRDLTHYFKSPTKPAPPSPKTQKTATKIVKIKSQEGLKTILSVQSTSKDALLEVEEKEETTTIKKRKKKKVKRRKHSDPAVTNITDLLNNSLSIVSPNNSLKNNPETPVGIVSPNTSPIESKEEIPLIIENEPTTPQQDKNKRIDAFSFLMNSRHKSIGQNLEGKEAPNCDNNDDDDVDKNKKKIHITKRKLQNWVDTKVDKKRKKLEEEEKDEYIEKQLEKRAKKLKKMLRIESNETQKKRKKIKAIIESDDSENSRDSSNEFESSNNKILAKTSEIKPKNKEFNIIKTPVKTPESHTTPKNKEAPKNLLSFFGVLNSPSKQTAQIEQHQQENTETSNKEIIKIKMFTPKRNHKKRKSSLSLKKTAHSPNKLDVNIFDTNPTITTEKKHKTRKHKKSKPDVNSDVTPRSLCLWKMKIKLGDDETEAAALIQNNQEDTIKVTSPLESDKHILQDTNLENILNNQESVMNESVILIENEQIVSRERRSTRVRRQVIREEEYIVSSGSDYDEPLSKQKLVSKKAPPVKVAPVFRKATKIDPVIAEARRQFLLSGIPDKLKILQEKQNSFEEIEFDVFPKIQHVYQEEPSNLWNLPSVVTDLNLKEISPVRSMMSTAGLTCTSLIKHNTTLKPTKLIRPEKVTLSKAILQQLKLENPKYPVYKVFKSLYEKSCLPYSNKSAVKEKSPPQKKKRGRKPKNKKVPPPPESDLSVEIIEPPEKVQINPQIHAMWTEKYKPKCLDDIAGNNSSASELKKWLERWVNFDNKIKSKRKRRNCSESEFEDNSCSSAITDCDSRDSIISASKNTIILRGAHGSGKSCSVYAICNELGFNVIEINASSKRTGKRVLQELQEATQSHQVRKNNNNNSQDLLSQFFKEATPKEEKPPIKKRSCVILVEDIDIVFEQDEGFINSLSQLIQTSKRPIIMTTTDDTALIIQKFVQVYPILTYYPICAATLGTWLTILCLIEGVLVDIKSMGHLLETNKGDVRKTMLQLQFWTQSGGNYNKIITPHEIINDNDESNEHLSLELDDNSNLSMFNDEVFEEKNTTRNVPVSVYYKIARDEGTNLCMPERLELGKLWWNIPNLLNFPKDVLKSRLEKINSVSEEKTVTPIKKLKLLSRFYDSLSLVDIMSGKNDLTDLEPCVKQWDNPVKDSLELRENFEEYNTNSDVSLSISSTLLNGYLGQLNDFNSDVNMAVPTAKERRWRAKQHLSEDILQDVLNYSTFVERKAVSLDYMPALRQIARAEQVRSSTNNKRGNRFNHYLKNLGVKCNETSCNLICNILKTTHSEASV